MIRPKPHTLLFVLTLWMVLISSLSAEQSANELFISGNIAYGNGSFVEAEQAYRQVLEVGRSAEVHFNLGNALAQQGKWSEASFHYMKAYSLNPNFEPARANLLLAASKMNLANEFPQLSNPARLLSQSGWTLVAAIAFWAALILFFYRDFVSFTIPLARSIGVISLICLLVSAVAIVQHQLFKDWSVVSSPIVSLRVAPTDASPGDSILIEGDPIRVLGEQAGFYHVMTSAGDEGYILLDEIHPIGND
ncbi:tetratricopeptide repeat protein [Puniceicoccales bacterium CK1056]|uniref:Tetratricopeptide repeat protein n=1 Tax=Oceanipulchritudo coccoides TaxID=2706888 RepID=A0A6B2LXJ4_9BACT|nr:tetratricopeptide repeat protein [Oceanipulchritudo coccoides]NDV61298.1 tetratricopeptide repeat protein [Oceanipulchritudo coccoides]